ncbi:MULTISPECIES: TetR/AcrR family transcriptional regulator [unclassified Streptomyces]|uniref:TetR/AcrR family transcriptional regulator n=1 Tax=unclassified Streptomyces TaxID=2593676 RepID=UPI00099E39FD|nr:MULTISPECIES: TetR/AcrR family transcriptional regulator [unclassified Streptomyces]
MADRNAGTGTETGAETGADTAAKSPRERYRAQVRAEIKQRAWEQIATAGASALSLNAIAKQMGMSGPALYRYFAGRDELITELIRDAYRSLADAFRAAPAADAGLPAIARALRAWALADPHRYFLVYGTPVPGYHAPDDITAIASEIMASLLDACAAEGRARAEGEAGAAPDNPATSFAARLEGLGHQWAHGHPAPAAAAYRALTFWTRLHGVLSLELAGHFTGMGFDAALLFDAELSTLAAPYPGPAGSHTGPTAAPSAG